MYLQCSLVDKVEVSSGKLGSILDYTSPGSDPGFGLSHLASPGQAHIKPSDKARLKWVRLEQLWALGLAQHITRSYIPLLNPEEDLADLDIVQCVITPASPKSNERL